MDVHNMFKDALVFQDEFSLSMTAWWERSIRQHGRKMFGVHLVFACQTRQDSGRDQRWEDIFNEKTTVQFCGSIFPLSQNLLMETNKKGCDFQDIFDEASAELEALFLCSVNGLDTGSHEEQNRLVTSP